MDKLKQTFKSRKFWAAVVALVVAFFGERAGVEQAALQDAVQVLMVYILGTGLEDGLRGLSAR